MPMSQLEIRLVPLLRDNYAYLLREPDTKATAILDPSEAAPVLRVLDETGWKLTHILNTHHHHDHTGGNLELKAATGATIVGPRADRERIAGIDVAVGEGDDYVLGNATARIFDGPGPTRG